MMVGGAEASPPGQGRIPGPLSPLSGPPHPTSYQPWVWWRPTVPGPGQLRLLKTPGVHIAPFPWSRPLPSACLGEWRAFPAAAMGAVPAFICVAGPGNGDRCEDCSHPASWDGHSPAHRPREEDRAWHLPIALLLPDPVWVTRGEPLRTRNPAAGPGNRPRAPWYLRHPPSPHKLLKGQ